jgi:hypothetical protein
MKELIIFVLFCSSVLGWTINKIRIETEDNIRASQPFVFEKKEWLCSYTSRQVDINLLEEQIKELKDPKK